MLTWNTGVDFFFVLSGFVLFWSYRPQQKYPHFIIRRLARIYPLHLIFLCLAVLSPITLYPKTWETFLAEVFLVHAWWVDPAVKYAFNGVSWTLSNELFFYLCAPLIIGWGVRRHGFKGAFSLLFAAIVIVGISFTALRNGVSPLIDTLPIFRIFEFIAGVFSAFAVSNMMQNSTGLNYPCKYIFSPWVAGMSLIVILLALSHTTTSQLAIAIVVTPVICWVLLSFAILDTRHHKNKRSVERYLTLAGETSFAFYLCHELVILNVQHFLRSSVLPTYVLVFLTLGISSLIAYCAHRFIEKPAQRWIINRFVKSSGGPIDK